MEKRLSIAPVPPTLDGPRDAYDIEFEPSWDGRKVKWQYNMYGWQFNHSNFESIAECLAGADMLFTTDRKWFASSEASPATERENEGR